MPKSRSLADLGSLAAPEKLSRGAEPAIRDFGIVPEETVSELVGKVTASPVSPALNAVADGSEPVTETLEQTADASLGEVAKGAARTSTPVSETEQATTANAIGFAAEMLVHPLEVAGDSVSGVGHTFAGAPNDDVRGEDQLIASAGSIPFPAATVKHEIIENGRYTDYGITLKIDTEEHATGLSSTAGAQSNTQDADSAIDDSIPTVSTVKDVAERAENLVAGVDELGSRLGDHLL